MPKHGRQHSCSFNHPWDGTPEKARKPLKCALMVFDEGILTVLREPPIGLCLAQPGDVLASWGGASSSLDSAFTWSCIMLASLFRLPLYPAY